MILTMWITLCYGFDSHISNLSGDSSNGRAKVRSIKIVVYPGVILTSGLFFMEEIKNLLKENNEMLKKLCDWVDKHESTSYQNNENFKNFIVNLAANALLNPRR